MAAPVQPFLSHLVGVFHAPVQAWSRADGAIGGGAEGIYCGDERVVSHARLTVVGHELRAIATQVVSAKEVVFRYVVPVAAEVVDPLLTVRRTRRVAADSVSEELVVESVLRARVRLDLRLVLTTDCTAMEQVKQGRAAAERPLPGEHWNWRDKTTLAELDAPEAGVEVDGHDVSLRWGVEVEPGGSITRGWGLRLRDDSAPVVAARGEPIETPLLIGADPRLQRLADRAFSDINSLRIADRELPEDEFLAAGAPWFYTMFGRDSLIAAHMLLPVDNTMARGALRALAARQGTRTDPETAEQPGKILHEVRRTDMDVTSGETFHLPPVYYGTIDATPLWINLLHDAWRGGMPEDEVIALLDNLEAALRWLGEHGDSDGDGFLEYLDTSGHGLANQGWKDSGDSIRWHDGSIAEGPIALCEVQAYAYQAAVNGASMLDAFGRDGGEEWRAWAVRMRERFRKSFWCEDEHGRYPALALDAEKRPVDGISSNIGHLLGTGILDPQEQRLVVDRLLDPTMFSGYGIRTLSTTNGAYWPLRYHAGSVWSHDTAMAITGMLRDGFAEEAACVAEGLLTAAEGFGYRLPELFAGDPADEVWPPVPYPASCRPQAWAATSVVPIALALRALAGGCPAHDQGGATERLRCGPTPR